MSRKLSDLEPVTREKALRIIAAAPLVLGRELYITGGMRTYDEQNELYAIGRNGDDRRIVTNAKAGESWHNFGRAIDFAFEEYGTQRPTWSTTTSSEQRDWRLLGGMGEAIGFDWGGRFESLGDFGHFHFSDGMSTDKARAMHESSR